MSATGIDTTEFRQVFNVETDRLIRRRLYWFTLIWLSLSIFFLSFFAVASYALVSTSGEEAKDSTVEGIDGAPDGGLAVDPEARPDEGDERALSFVETLDELLLGTPTPSKQRAFAAVALFSVWYLVYGGALIISLKKHLSARMLIGISIGLLVLTGLVQIGLRVTDVLLAGLPIFILVHFTACCVFPWKPRQALVPVLVVLAVSLITRLTLENQVVLEEVLRTVLLSLSFAPAVLVSWWKHSQRLQTTSNKFLSQRYGMLRQELAYARQIHEAMFPEPKTEGELCFTYRYEPMRQIGGDYLHAHVVRTPDGHEQLSLVILDVTGHGIPAALTVNRLYGEIDLRFADDPELPPGELLGHLNRYVHLTLARHSIYATALCLRVDTKSGEVSYASGGHPPAFLRASDGTLTELGSTTFVLGACGDEDFDPQTARVTFKPGDAIVAYTDGATEARAPDGRMLRIEGLRSALIPGPVNPDAGEWPDHLLRLVANHRGGAAPEDDTLLVEIYRTLSPIGSSLGAEQAREPGGNAPAGAPA